MAFRCYGMIGLLVLGGSVLHADEWKFDVLHLKNGNHFEGLILEETKDSVSFKHIIRKPGNRTCVIETVFAKEEIARTERLKADERKELIQRLESLDHRGEREAERMKALQLQTITWPNNSRAVEFKGRHFIFQSNARDDIVRQAIVRLEDIFQAYTDRLGTRREPKQLTRIVLFRSSAEYRAVLDAAGLPIRNPSYYDLTRNQIVAATDLEQRAEELDKLRKKHDAFLLELDEQEKKLNRHYNGRIPRDMLIQLRQTRHSIQAVNNENESTFDRMHHPLYQTLYHEAFHAYLDNFVYPNGEVAVPRWLNEGLAQIFETALVETGELRVGHVDQKRLLAVQDAIKQKKLVSLAELFASEPQHFAVKHMSDAFMSDRYFLAAWALAYYLTFDRKLLGTESMHRYVNALNRGTERLTVFRELVNQPLPEFEKQFHLYLLNLRQDGSQKAP